MKEVWKPISGFGGKYHISCTGIVRSHKRRSVKIMTTFVAHGGYVYVKLRGNDMDGNKLLHRIIAQAFIPNPLGKPQVNHKDGIKTNNHISNLEWATAMEDAAHRIEVLGKTTRGENHGASKLQASDIKDIFSMHKNGLTYKDIAGRLNVSPSNIYLIIKGINWKHLNMVEKAA